MQLYLYSLSNAKLLVVANFSIKYNNNNNNNNNLDDHDLVLEVFEFRVLGTSVELSLRLFLAPCFTIYIIKSSR